MWWPWVRSKGRSARRQCTESGGELQAGQCGLTDEAQRLLGNVYNLEQVVIVPQPARGGSNQRFLIFLNQNAVD